MPDDDVITAMRRKAGVGRPPPDVTAMTTAKALKLAVAKAAEDGTGMVMQVSSVVESATSITKLPDEIPDNALIGVLEGALGTYGLAIFSLTVTASVVEQMTTGAVLKIDPEVRKPTSTDSVMCFELMNGILRTFETIIEELPDPPDIAGYKATAHLEETRSIPIAFDDIRYRMYRLSVDMGLGVRQGEVLLVFPAEKPKPKLEAGVTSQWAHQFQASVMTTRASLEAVLCRMSLPLSEVANLQVGTTLPIAADALGQIEIVADGRVISKARLGQLDDHRALRLDVASAGDQDESSLSVEEPAFGQLENPMESFGDSPAGLDLGMMSGSTEASSELGALGSSLGELADTLPPLADVVADLPGLDDLGADFNMDISDDLGDGFPAMSDLPSLDGV